MNDLKGNFKHDVKNVSGGIACVACGLEIEVNSHVMSCNEYLDMRSGKDLDNDVDLVNYVREVMARREGIRNGK